MRVSQLIMGPLPRVRLTVKSASVHTYSLSVPQSQLVTDFFFSHYFSSFSHFLLLLLSDVHIWRSERGNKKKRREPHLAALLSSPLCDSISSTSSSWPHCVAAVSLFNLSPSGSPFFYPSLTPFFLFTHTPLAFLLSSLILCFSPLSFPLFPFLKIAASLNIVLLSPRLCHWIQKNVVSVWVRPLEV